MVIDRNDMRIVLEFQKPDREIDIISNNERSNNYYGDMFINYVNHSNFAIINVDDVINKSTIDNKIDLAIDIRNYGYSFVNFQQISEYTKIKKNKTKKYSTLIYSFLIIDKYINDNDNDNIFINNISNLQKKYGKYGLIIGTKSSKSSDNGNIYNITTTTSTKNLYNFHIDDIEDINIIYKCDDTTINKYRFYSLYRYYPYYHDF